MINQQRLINTFCDLVRIDSPTGQEQNVAQYIQNWLQKNLAINPQQDNLYNVFATYEGGDNKTLLLNAHTDTVEPGCGIEPIVTNEKITSAGNTILGADNKAALAAILEAVLTIHENNLPHPSLELLFTSQEESENVGALQFDHTQIKSKDGYCFDCAQPIGNIIIASPYYIRFDVTITGKEAHASKPEQGINIIPLLQKYLQNIPLGNVDDCLVNIGLISAGTARNTIMGTAKLSGEIRGFHENKVLAKLEELKNIFRSQEGIETIFTHYKENDGYIIDQNNKHLLYTEKILQNNKIKTHRIFDGGCSDANIFRTKGINIINVAEGIYHPHTTNEYVKLSEFKTLTNLMIKLITKY